MANGNFLVHDIYLNNRHLRVVMEQPDTYDGIYTHSASILYRNYSLVFIQSKYRDRLYASLKRALLVCAYAHHWDGTIWVSLDDDTNGELINN